MSAETNAAKNKNLALRFATAGVAVPFILWALLIAPHYVWATFVLAPAMAIAAHELFRMVLPGALVLQGWGILCTLAMGGIFYLSMVSATPSPLLVPGILVLVLASLLMSLSRPVPSEAAGPRMAWLVAGPFYIGATISTLAALHAQEHGGQWVVLSMMLAWFADTGGYFAGRFLGGKIFGPQQDVAQHLAQQDLGGRARCSRRGTGGRAHGALLVPAEFASPGRARLGAHRLPAGHLRGPRRITRETEYGHQGQRQDRPWTRRAHRSHRRPDVHLDGDPDLRALHPPTLSGPGARTTSPPGPRAAEERRRTTEHGP